MKIPNIEDVNGNLKTFCLPRFIKKRFPEFYDYLISRYPNHKKITEPMWLFYNNLNEPPKCPCCGNPAKFKNWSEGYSEYCSRKCMSKSTRNKAKKTMIEKYGGIGMASEITKKKIIKTSKEKYGGIGMASEEIRSKIQEKMTSKYGADIPMKCKELREKIENTHMERYGVKHALQHPEFLEKSKQTCLKNNGVLYPGQSSEIMGKVINTQNKRYGGVGMASKEIRNKIKKTNLERYGREFGFDYDKIKKTNLERYGDENPLIAKCSRGEIKFKGYSELSQQFFEELDKILKDRFTTQYATKNGEYCAMTDSRKYYIDYYIKELNIAIEFNGDTWHGNPTKYKADDKCFPMDSNITAKDLWELDELRRKRLESIGIKTIVMWESEYKKCKDIKNWLENKLQIYF